MELTLTVLLIVFASVQDGAPSAEATFSVRVTGQGPPVIFIPGLTSPGSVWDKAVAAIQDRYTCHVLTLAGFAGQPPVKSPSLNAVRADLGRYIRQQRLGKPVLVGHSVGGFLAYWVAATDPELVGGVLTVDGATFMPALFDPSATPDKMKHAAEGMQRSIVSASAESFARQSDAQLASQISDDSERRTVAAAAARSDPRTTAQFLYELFTTDLREASRTISAPTLLLVGTRGIAADARAAYVASARAQLANIRSARVVEVPEARHFIQLDAPDTFARVLLDFLRSVPR